VGVSSDSREEGVEKAAGSDAWPKKGFVSGIGDVVQRSCMWSWKNARIEMQRSYTDFRPITMLGTLCSGLAGMEYFIKQLD
jgi:hypothetical protein